ncbi:MAG: HAMP domain-containing protein [Nitrococcus mobilis]|nr:HAMP domain-containing protein [Nitrococcus mobilis]
MRFDRHSLQFRLAWRLAAVFALTMVILTIGVFLEARETARSPEDWTPEGQAENSAQLTYREDFAHAVLEEFLTDVAWLIPVVAGLTLLIGVFSLRRGLRPLREVSAQARRIGPRDPSIRLAAEQLPSELVPLVRAVNQALDRLEIGMEQQRRFTANAAHQLRTPLAILTAGLDVLEGDGKIQALRDDVARMNRLVDQLLCVARLDSVSLDLSQVVDLTAVAAHEISALVPLALQKGCEIALEEAEAPIHIKGNPDAIADAVRNLIENAIAHSPSGGEITVSILAPATLRVADQGPGISVGLHEQVFERFWRARGERRTGAGLGLAIVRDIMHAHGSTVRIADNPGGGTVFILEFGSETRNEMVETNKINNLQPQAMDAPSDYDHGVNSAKN